MVHFEGEGERERKREDHTNGLSAEKEIKQKRAEKKTQIPHS